MTYILQNDSKKYLLKNLLGEGCTCKCYLGKKMTSNSLQETSESVSPFLFFFFFLYCSCCIGGLCIIIGLG